jgi:hypothetical protein
LEKTLLSSSLESLLDDSLSSSSELLLLPEVEDSRRFRLLLFLALPLLGPGSASDESSSSFEDLSCRLRFLLFFALPLLGPGSASDESPPPSEDWLGWRAFFLLDFSLLFPSFLLLSLLLLPFFFLSFLRLQLKCGSMTGVFLCLVPVVCYFRNS